MGWLLGAILRRYWIETKDLFGDQVNFANDTFHHIFGVCRQEVGSKFEVITELSKAYLIEVTYVGKKTATALVVEERVIPPLPEPHIHIALSISRFPVMDAVMEKAVEMGVKSIQPFFSEFSFVRKEEKISPNKLDRWEKIIRSATQQCGRGELMTIHPAATWDDLFSQINLNEQNRGLFAYEGTSTHGIKEYLQKQVHNPDSGLASVKNIWLFVGSEGGFSYQEVELMKQKKLEPVTLGGQVLRVETACIALVAALKYEFDLMR